MIPRNAASTMIHHSIIRSKWNWMKSLAGYHLIWMVWPTSSFQNSYHAQSGENVSLHWLAQKRIQTTVNNEPESKLIIVDGGCTTSLTSSFENCADCKPRITSVRTAEGGMTMQTTHVCMKTYYVRSRTGEIRPITANLSYVRR